MNASGPYNCSAERKQIPSDSGSSSDDSDGSFETEEASTLENPSQSLPEQGNELIMGGVAGSNQVIDDDGFLFQQQYAPSDPLLIRDASVPTNLAGPDSVENSNNMNTGSLVENTSNASSIQDQFVNSHSSSVTRPPEQSQTTIQKLLQNPVMEISAEIEKTKMARAAVVDANMAKTHKENLQLFLSGGVSDRHPTHNQSLTSSRNTSTYPQPEPVIARFFVTKLRNWRTGYPRILSFHQSYFVTLDPETYEITNQWTYLQIQHYLSLAPKEPDCMLIEVKDDPKASHYSTTTKLKFKCLPYNREEAITILAERIYFHHQQQILNAPSQQQQQQQQKYAFFQHCHRFTRSNTKVPTSLQCAPHGLVEIDPNTGLPLQVYLYRCIEAISFTKDEESGIVLYVKSGVGRNRNGTATLMEWCNHCVPKVFFITSSRLGGSGRSDLVTVLKKLYQVLGVDWRVAESVAMQEIVRRKMERGSRRNSNTQDSSSNNVDVGERTASFRVMKFSERCRHKRYDGLNNGGRVLRQLVLTSEGYIMEWDCGKNVDGKAGIQSLVVNCRDLRDVTNIIRHDKVSTLTETTSPTTQTHSDNDLTIEFQDGSSRTYSSQERDTVIVAILDATINIARNINVTVMDVQSAPYRLVSLALTQGTASSSGILLAESFFHTETVEDHCLKRVHHTASAANAYLEQCSSQSVVEECAGVVDVCREFNVNVSMKGIQNLPMDNQAVIVETIKALWGLVLKLYDSGYHSKHQKKNIMTTSSPEELSMEMHVRKTVNTALCPIFQSLYRLMLTPIGYQFSTEERNALEMLPKIWQIENTLSLYWSLKCVSALVLPRPFAQERDQESEVRNKGVILGNVGGMADGLVQCMMGKSLATKADSCISDLILMVVSNILESILCSHHDSTAPEHFSNVLNSLANGYGALMALLCSSTSVIMENTVLLLHLITIKTPETAKLVRETSLTSGLLLQHFYNAVFSASEGQRYLSRYLCNLWMTGPPPCAEKRLLKRMVPSGFFSYLKMPLLGTAEESQLDILERDNGTEMQDNTGDSFGGTNTVRLRSRIRNLSFTATSTSSEEATESKENFRIFFHVLSKDHALPDLIWNQQTRRELRIALESELQSIHKEIETRGGLENMAWNHEQFTVPYPSLRDEVQVGEIYMRLWLQTGNSFIKTWENPSHLFELLFRRLLCEIDRDEMVTNMCIRCLERLYAMKGAEIGVFPDIMILVRSMQKTRSIETQHRLLNLIVTLLGKSASSKISQVNFRDNAEQMLNMESVSFLCQIVAWGHTNNSKINNILSSTISQGNNIPQLTYDTQNKNVVECCNTASETVNEDNSSPAVWYTAPAGKIPPPTNIVKGPFRVSELRSLMNEGDLHEHSLVTSSYTDDYDMDDLKIDTGEWRMIKEVWQLRWQLCSDTHTSTVYDPSQLALMGLKCLSCLATLHSSVDSRGIPYFPIPIAKRLICGMVGNFALSAGEQKDSNGVNDTSTLSIIAQATLCTNPHVVEESAILLRNLMIHNGAACSKLYLTGLFFFVCSYTGSNILSLAQLLQDTHLRQHFRPGLISDDNDLSIKERSILGNILPIGLLNILVNHGAKSFAEAFVGNVNTPEVIWSFDMRRYLVEMIQQHLGTFVGRLHQHTTEQYEYCPIPNISYSELERELFCHKYYLKNLCNEEKFPNWPISEPVKVFHACLQKWEMISAEENVYDKDAQYEAQKLLGLKPGDGGNELRKAYRKNARRYHPDKNPQGRDMFEKIQKSYEILLTLCHEGGTIQIHDHSDGRNNYDYDLCEGITGSTVGMNMVDLLIRTQLLICKRYPDDIAKFKYPAYQMLLSCFQLPSSSLHGDTGTSSTKILSSFLLKPKRLQFSKLVIDLVFNTCLVSPLNAEELVVENGIPILEDTLDFYITAADLLSSEKLIDSQNEVRTTIGEIIVLVVHTISGVAYYENGRGAILALPDPMRLCRNWCRCLDIQFLPKEDNSCDLVKKYALEGLASMTRSTKLQRTFTISAWSLVRTMLDFDSTFIAPDESLSAGKMIQHTKNDHAELAARALGMMCGVMTGNLATSPNLPLYGAMKKVLTPPMAILLRNSHSRDLLTSINTNVETPTRVWNANMQNELKSFLASIEAEDQDVKAKLAASNTFFYSNLQEEVNIGGIYLRIFNNLGGGRDGIREISDCSHFARCLLEFIAKCLLKSQIGKGNSKISSFLQRIESSRSIGEEEESYPIESSRFSKAVQALLHLVRLDGLVDEVICADYGPSVLLCLLELPNDICGEANEFGYEILSLLSPKQTFADEIAKQCILMQLIRVLEKGVVIPNGRDALDDESANSICEERRWSVLESLASSSSIAEAIVSGSGWLELLGIIVGYTYFTKRWVGRQGAAKTLSRLLWDPNTSVLIAPLLEKFLPLAIISILKNSGYDAMLIAFDGENETPELIWNSDMRKELRVALANQLDKIFISGNIPADLPDEFTLPPGFSMSYSQLKGELNIGGVYVRLFLKDPTFDLRDPSGFLEMLLARWSQELEQVTNPSAGYSGRHSSLGGVIVKSSEEDVLGQVTSAAVHLCRLRSHLCENLAQWGHVVRAIIYTHKAVDLRLIGVPLISAIRLLNVASSEKCNIEAIVSFGDSSGQKGFIEGIMKAIGKSPLHHDSAFIVDTIKRVVIGAIGDVHGGSGISQAGGGSGGSTNMNDTKDVFEYNSHNFDDSSFLALAPSFAPGTDPVKKMMDAKNDHPFAMLFSEDPAPQQQDKRSSRNTALRRHQTTQPAVTNTKPAVQSSKTEQRRLHNTRQTKMASSSQMSKPVPSAPGKATTNRHRAYVPENAALHTQRLNHSNISAQGQNQRNKIPIQVERHVAPTSQPLSFTTKGEKSVSTKQPTASAGRYDPSMKQNRQRMETQQNAHRNTNQANIASHSKEQKGSQHARTNRSHGNLAAFENPLSNMKPESKNLSGQTNSGNPNPKNQTVSAPVMNTKVEGPHQSKRNKSIVQNHSVPRSNSIDTAQVIPNTMIQTETSIKQFPPIPQNELSSQKNAIAQTSLPPPPINTPPPPVNAPPPPPPTPLTITESTNKTVPASLASNNNGMSTQPFDQNNFVPMGQTTGGAPGCIQGRSVLFSTIIRCKLPEFLLEDVLENSTLTNVKDPGSVKMHVVEMLQILTLDPEFGMQFKQILANIPSWKKYEHQDHSFFGNSKGKNTDYFLIETEKDSVKKITYEVDNETK